MKSSPPLAFNIAGIRFVNWKASQIMEDVCEFTRWQALQCIHIFLFVHDSSLTLFLILSRRNDVLTMSVRTHRILVVFQSRW
jgi:hypothetical protein